MAFSVYSLAPKFNKISVCVV